MITWMQKHKKWLIITIWISTIAFVGAGFVGWGSYDYGKSNNTVAIVGDKEVSINDLQSEYNNLYSQYQNMLGDSFNKEMAKQFNLENIALQTVIQKYLLLNYADQLGLMTTDKEVAQELLKIKAFFKDGKFDKNQYMQILKQNRQTIAQFESRLKQDLLVQKIQNIFNLKLTQNEIQNIGQILYAKDQVSVKVIDTDKIIAKVNEDEIKKYWDTTKENYKSPSGYDLSFTKIDNIDGNSKKQMRKVALKLYVRTKKDNSLLKSSQVIYQNSNYFDKGNMQKLSKASNNTLLKPIYKDGNYYIVKLNKKIAPTILPYDKVKENVKMALLTTKKEKLINKKIDKLLKTFKGKDIGFISRDSKITIDGLDQQEIQKLSQAIFTSTKKSSVIKFANKIVLFKITDTKLANFDTKNTNAVEYTTQRIKAQLAISSLLKQLENRYTIKSFMKE